MAANALQKAFTQLSAGKRINSAADDAAGLAVAEKLTAQIEGLDRGSDNTRDMQNLINTAEGGLANVSDSLQRMRELSLQAANGALNDSDRRFIQYEIDQIKDEIGRSAQTLEFNTQKLLDGSFQNKNTASGADGTGASVSIADVSLIAGDLSDYDVTDPAFDISRIDDAISRVSEARAQIGVMSNRFDSTVNANQITNLNQAAARSRIADADYAKAANEMNKNQILQQYQIFNVNRQIQDEQQKNRIFGISV